MRQFPVEGDKKKPDSFEKKVMQFAQDREHERGTAAYTTATIDPGEFKLATISGTSYIYTRIGSSIFRVSLTAV